MVKKYSTQVPVGTEPTVHVTFFRSSVVNAAARRADKRCADGYIVHQTDVRKVERSVDWIAAVVIIVAKNDAIRAVLIESTAARKGFGNVRPRVGDRRDVHIIGNGGRRVGSRHRRVVRRNGSVGRSSSRKIA